MLCGSKIAAILKSKYFQQFVHHPTQTQSELWSMFAYLLMTNEKQVRAFHLKNIISLMGVSQISTPMRLTQNFPGFLMGRGKATFKYIEYFLFMLFTYLQSFVGDHLGVMWQRPHGIAEIVGALNLILKTGNTFICSFLVGQFRCYDPRLQGRWGAHTTSNISLIPLASVE